MLVIDRVELPVLDQAQQVRELHRNCARGLQQDRQSSGEVVQVGHVRQHVVGADQVGLLARGGEPMRCHHTKEGDLGRHAARFGHGGDIGGRLHAEDSDALAAEVPQQIAVVAGQFHDQRIRAEPKLVLHPRRIRLRVTQPGLGERREIRVVREDGGGRRERLELHQQAFLTDIGVQRIVRLHLAELVGRQERIRQRRAAEIDKVAPEFGAAEATGRGGHGVAGSSSL